MFYSLIRTIATIFAVLYQSMYKSAIKLLGELAPLHLKTREQARLGTDFNGKNQYGLVLYTH